MEMELQDLQAQSDALSKSKQEVFAGSVWILVHEITEKSACELVLEMILVEQKAQWLNLLMTGT